MNKVWRVIASLAFLSPMLVAWAERQFKAMPKLPELPSEDTSLPSLSIIIPARNEAENLKRLLPSLKAVRYPGQMDVIVVDDGSTDGTGEIARQLGARVISLTELPPGWLGKPNACHEGAKTAQGDWLLFTDADTRHQPYGPAQAVAYARQHNLDGLSIFLKQETYGLADVLALTVGFAGLFAGKQDNRPVLNGQFILLRRAAYIQSGGFAAVRAEPLEDLALAHHLKQQGYQLPIMLGENAASVRMYTNFGALWRGLTRIGGGSLRWSGSGGAVTILFITAAMTPLLTLLLVVLRQLRPVWLVLTWLAVIPGFIGWARRFGAGWEAVLVPFGGLLIQVAASWGLINWILGRGVRWKDRTV